MRFCYIILIRSSTVELRERQYVQHGDLDLNPLDRGNPRQGRVAPQTPLDVALRQCSQCTRLLVQADAGLTGPARAALPAPRSGARAPPGYAPGMEWLGSYQLSC